MPPALSLCRDRRPLEAGALVDAVGKRGRRTASPVPCSVGACFAELVVIGSFVVSTPSDRRASGGSRHKGVGAASGARCRLPGVVLAISTTEASTLALALATVALAFFTWRLAKNTAALDKRTAE